MKKQSQLPKTFLLLLLFSQFCLCQLGAEEYINCEVLLRESPTFCTIPPMHSGADEEWRQRVVNKCCCPPNCGKKKQTKQTNAAISKVCPKAPGTSGNVALIAANDYSRATIFFQGNPNTTLGAWIEGDIPGAKLMLGVVPEKGRRLAYSSYPTYEQPAVTKTDAGGKAVVHALIRVYYDGPDYKIKPLSKPYSFNVMIREVGQGKQTVSAEVTVGLGLKLDQAKLILVSADLKKPPHFAWRTALSSSFHKNLDIHAYYQGIKECSSGVPLPLVNVQSVAINFGETGKTAALDDGIGGKEDYQLPNSKLRKTIGQVMEFGRDAKGTVFLTPWSGNRGQVSYRHFGQTFPAVRQLRDGKFIKGYFGFLKIATQNASFSELDFFNQASLEPRVFDKLIYVFSMDSPESVSTSLLCMLEAQSLGQMFALQAVSLLPLYGDVADLSVGMLNSFCYAARGKYQDFFIQMGYSLGKAGLAKYVRDGLIPRTVEGEWNPKFYRLLGIDPTTLTADQKMILAESLKGAYNGAVSYLEIRNWKPPQ